MRDLDVLFRRIADEEDALRTADPATERLVRRLAPLSARPRPSVRVWALLAASLGVLGVVLGVVLVQRRATLAVTVGGGTPLVGTWLGAPDAKPLPLDFSDGSRFELAAKSRGRVVALERATARVELASGLMRVHVVPRGMIGWQIDAGKFGVRITGTRFDVRYQPDGEVLELSVEEGQVELSGCVFGRARKLAAGQRVRASCQTGELHIGYRDSAPSVAEAPRLPPAVAAAPSEPPAVAPLEPKATGGRDAAPGAAPPPLSWLALAKAGKYADAYAAAQRDGFEAECAKGTPEALAMLADVARHAGAPRRAEQALLALRKRFPGTPDAALAAFALGRLEFDEYRAYPAAANWFRAYLKERPGGPMTREALGRLLEALHRAGDNVGARAVAERYLRDYPSGPHAELASRVVPSR